MFIVKKDVFVCWNWNLSEGAETVVVRFKNVHVLFVLPVCDPLRVAAHGPSPTPAHLVSGGAVLCCWAKGTAVKVCGVVLWLLLIMRKDGKKKVPLLPSLINMYIECKKLINLNFGIIR